MIELDKEYWINHPLFLKYKEKFDLKKWRVVRKLKSAFLNERVVEVPFVIRELGNLPAGAKVLDIGCSESLLPLHLASLGLAVTGVDLRDYPYHAPNFQFLKVDILDPAFKGFVENQFDAILCVSVLEHIGLGCYEEPQKVAGADQRFLEKITCYLKPGGILILTVPFGVKQTTDWQRFYNDDDLQNLLNGYTIENKKYFGCYKRSGDKCNYWEAIGQPQAATIKSNGHVECVCCLKAIKR